MAFLNRVTYTEKDNHRCFFCSQRYPSKRDLDIHEYIHGNDVREAIFNLAIQPRNNYLVYEEFIYACGKMKSGVLVKEVGCAETPEQEAIDEKSPNKKEFYTSASQPCPATPDQDTAYRYDSGTDLFAYKTFHGGIAMEPIDDSANMLKAMTKKIIAKYETFPKRNRVKHREKWADRYKTSLISQTSLEGNSPTANSGVKGCGSAFRMEPGFTIGSESRRINT